METLLIVLAIVAQTADAPKRSVPAFDWTPTIWQGAGVSADALTTWAGAHGVRKCGEANARYHTDGDWRRPDYGKMWRDNAIAVGTHTVTRWVIHRVREQRPNSKSLRWMDRGLGALQIGSGVWRGGQAASNLWQCM